jgi:fumarate reductase subunit D
VFSVFDFFLPQSSQRFSQSATELFHFTSLCFSVPSLCSLCLNIFYHRVHRGLTECHRAFSFFFFVVLSAFFVSSVFKYFLPQSSQRFSQSATELILFHFSSLCLNVFYHRVHRGFHRVRIHFYIFSVRRLILKH